jgi:hypothetical protein
MDNENEIKELKSIIRNLDNRINYLEKRINDIINKNDIYRCYICSNYCTYDDEKCDFNMFCMNYICKKCIYIIKKNNDNETICKNRKCNKWYCSDCLYYCNNNEYIKKCEKCNLVQCIEHYCNQTNLSKYICRNCNTMNLSKDLSVDKELFSGTLVKENANINNDDDIVFI